MCLQERGGGRTGSLSGTEDNEYNNNSTCVALGRLTKRGEGRNSAFSGLVLNSEARELQLV